MQTTKMMIIILCVILLVLVQVSLGQEGQEGVSAATMRALQDIQAKLNTLSETPMGIDRALLQEKIAVTYSQIGGMEASATYFEAAAETLDTIGKPGKESWFNAGMTYLNIHNYGKAESTLQRCVEIEPMFRPAHIKLASLYRDKGDLMRVQEHLQRAIQITPRSPDAYMYLADTYNNLKQFALAIEQYKIALSLSGHPDAIATIACSMGDTYVNLKQHSRALKAYAQGKRQLQASDAARGCATIGYYYAASEVGKWHNFEAAEADTMRISRGALGAGPEAPPTAQTPYRLLFHQDPALSLVTAVKWSNALVAKEWEERKRDTDTDKGANGSSAPADDSPTDQIPVLNIVYMSRRHHDYPGTQLMLRLFGSHNRSAVTVKASSTGPNDKSSFRDVIIGAADSSSDLASISPTAGASSMVHGQAPADIIVDYDGAHDFNNFALLAKLRLIPSVVQPIVATWLGFAGTSGLGDRVRTAHVTAKYGRRPNSPPAKPGSRAAIDYLMADTTVLPPDSSAARACTEYIVYLPGGCYQPQDEYQAADTINEPDVTELERIAQKAAVEPLHVLDANELLLLKAQLAETMGVKEGESSKIATSPWVACLNRVSKISPDVFRAFLQLLIEVPTARLVLLQDSVQVTRELRRVAVAHGVRPARLLFFPRAPKALYMQLLSVSSIFADTRAYGSHTVASDAMFVGLPVLTVPGTTFASRVGASLNLAAKTTEMTALSERAWLAAGVRLLRSRYLLEGMHRKVANAARGAQNTQLFNSTMFAAGLERAYMGMSELARRPNSGPVTKHLFFDSSLRS